MAGVEIELAERCESPEKNPGGASQRSFRNDEAVIGRFGKRQQFRVSAFYYSSYQEKSAPRRCFC